MTLPNGVVVSYGYDAVGRRIAMGGSLARVNLPAAVASMGYDAANRMTTRGLSTLTYDANGNLTGDGTNSYTWNARDQLSGMTGTSFAYDAGGRRRSKTVGGTGTSFLYDGANAVQETGGAGTANILGGLGMDEMFQRTDAGGTRSFQTDGLGSVLGLMDGAGTVTTAYTYEAFGGATASGAAAANSAGFTGRENDGTGLMFYRARYYSPALGRFISEDPLGFGGGDVNLYAYVGNGPTNATDPTGLIFGGLMGYSIMSGSLSFLFEMYTTFFWGVLADCRAGAGGERSSPNSVPVAGVIGGLFDLITPLLLLGAPFPAMILLSVMLGALSNYVQYVATQAADGKPVDARTAIYQAGLGAAGNLAAGALRPLAKILVLLALSVLANLAATRLIAAFIGNMDLVLFGI